MFGVCINIRIGLVNADSFGDNLDKIIDSLVKKVEKQPCRFRFKDTNFYQAKQQKERKELKSS